ncbi:MAG: hypothetical protein N2651_04350 [Fimbriimonadales bacterium]|nr:hypothetical protein [Fimbriimonadales bacterium]
MKHLTLLLATVLCVAIALAQQKIEDDTPSEPVRKTEIHVPKIAVYPWSFAENERGTNEQAVRSVQDLLRKSFENRAGMEILPEARCRAAWMQLGNEDFPLTVEDPGQLPRLPSAKKLLDFGEALGADYVCAGTVSWRVRSVWVGLGPKTKAEATVNVIIIDVKRREIVLDVRDFSSGSNKAEKWYETAGALLVSWGITLFSGGPKTPHMQRAGVIAVGAAIEPFFSAAGRKIE